MRSAGVPWRDRTAKAARFLPPVVDVLTNRIIAAEALIRWTHPTLGPLSPAEFIPIVEQNNLERMLGKFVVEEVSGFLRQLDAIDRGISISMNLCPTELQDPDLVGHMVRVLDSKDISHERLIIELTERTLLTDMKAANSFLDKLHLEHIQVAIDDFGTGFSSLSYLHELNVDVLKIDRSFIKDYPDQE
jgi:EAL domain-containing protein (putative c-di-GMP-specific phosphodiesterase class I)